MDWKEKPDEGGWWWTVSPSTGLIVVRVYLAINRASSCIGTHSIDIFPGPWLKIEEPQLPTPKV